MNRIRPTLQAARTGKDTELSLRLVNHWIENLRIIPYAFSRQWKTPSEVESGAVADCKGKAVALYEKMRRCGRANIRLVIGRRTAVSRSTHAWLEWSAPEGTYILDPTINWMAFKTDQVGKENYVPFYAYSGSHKFCATTTALLAKN
jgi:predicted transglutaminase-like cysteine proteinase